MRRDGDGRPQMVTEIVCTDNTAIFIPITVASFDQWRRERSNAQGLPKVNAQRLVWTQDSDGSDGSTLEYSGMTMIDGHERTIANIWFIEIRQEWEWSIGDLPATPHTGSASSLEEAMRQCQQRMDEWTASFLFDGEQP